MGRVYHIGDQTYYEKDGVLAPIDRTDYSANKSGEDVGFMTDQDLGNQKEFSIAHPNIQLSEAQKMPGYGYTDYKDESTWDQLKPLVAMAAMAFGAPYLGEALGAGETAGLVAADSAAGLIPATDLATMTGAAAEGTGALSTVSQMGEAVKNYLSKYLEPNFLASEAGKSVVSNGIQQLMTTGTIDPGKLLDPEQFIKNMGMQALTGAGSAGAGAGISDLTGWSPNVSNQLGTAAVRGATGKNPTSSLVRAGLSALDVPSNISKYAAPAITGLVSGKEPDFKSIALKGILDQAQLPDLGWTDKSSPLSWVTPAVKSGITRGVAGKLRG